MRCVLLLACLAVVGVALAQPNDTPQSGGCAEALKIEGHGGTTTRYALAEVGGVPPEQRMALLMLIGDGGVIVLDDKG